jgi:hypothetical protein
MTERRTIVDVYNDPNTRT